MKQTLTQRIKLLEDHKLAQHIENRAIYERLNKMQKEIKQLKHDLAKHMYQDNLDKELQKDPDCMLRSNKDKSYTAMRSTGEVFCQCEHPQPRFAGLSNVIQYCMLCSRQISKQTTPVCCRCEKEVNKPQEDVRCSVLQVLWKLYEEGYSNSKSLIKRENLNKETDRILAIVKGE